MVVRGIQISFLLSSFLLFVVPNMACLLLLLVVVVMEATCHWWGSLRGLRGFIVSDFMLNFDLFRFWLSIYISLPPPLSPQSSPLTFFSLLVVMREDGTEFGEDFRKVGIGELGCC
jgi:hypothetical protein